MFVGGFVGAQGVGNIAALIQIVDVQGVDFTDAVNIQLRQQLFGDFIIGAGQYFAGFGHNHVGGQNFANQAVGFHIQAFNAGSGNLAQVFGGDAFALRHQYSAVFAHNIEFGGFAFQARQHQRGLYAVFGEEKLFLVIKHRQHLLIGVTQGFEQNGYRHFAAAVDTEVEQVFGVEFEVQPRATVRNNAGGKQQFAGRMGFAPVVLEEHAGRAVQLRHNHALGAVNHKRAARGHQRDFAHIHFVFTHFFHHIGLRRFFVQNHQTDACTQRGGIGDAAQLAFLDIKQRLAQHIMHKFQAGIAIVAHNRENRIKGCLKAFFIAFVVGLFQLQKLGVGIQLGGQQKRHFQYIGTLGKTFANAFFFGKGVRHGRFSN